jgi:hypothetical protein
MIRYVWYNIADGTFSDSWADDEYSDEQLQDAIDHSKENLSTPTWKLLRYECVNDNDFEFSKLMHTN